MRIDTTKLTIQRSYISSLKETKKKKYEKQDTIR